MSADQGQLYGSDVVFSDDTTLHRGKRGGIFLSVKTAANEPYVAVEASVDAAPDLPWIGRLRALTNGVWPIKWKTAAPVVTYGIGFGPTIIREGLSQATIVIVDPTETYREVDLMLGTRHRRVPSIGSSYLRNSPLLAPALKELDSMVVKHLLERSGLGLAGSLLGSRSPWPRGARYDFSCSEPIEVVQVAKGLGTSLKRAARVAMQTTTLLSHEHDPDRQQRLLLRVGERLKLSRFLSVDREFTQARIEALALRKQVYDEGHAEGPTLAAQLQHRAQARLKEETRFNREVLPPAMGFVIERSDDEALQLGLADVAANYARWLFEQQGLRAVVETFRLVIFNGQRLTRERAGYLDEKRVFHSRLITAFDSVVSVSPS